MNFKEASKWLRDNADNLPSTFDDKKGKRFFDLPDTLDRWRKFYQNESERENIKHKIVELVTDLQNTPEGWDLPPPTKDTLWQEYINHKKQEQ